MADLDGVIARLRSSSQFSRLDWRRQDEFIAELAELIGYGQADLSPVTRVSRLRRNHEPSDSRPGAGQRDLHREE